MVGRRNIVFFLLRVLSFAQGKRSVAVLSRNLALCGCVWDKRGQQRLEFADISWSQYRWERGENG